MEIAMKFFVLVIFAYFMGNINFARILSKTRNDDITKHDSGNPGTMNMLRTHGVKLGVFTLIFDAIKAVIPCLIGQLLLFRGDPYLAELSIYVAGLSCVLGHMYPVIHKFKGGKGVASGFGMAMVANPISTSICLAVFIITLLIFKIASLSSMICAVGFVVTETVLLALHDYYLAIALLWVLFFLIIYAHRSNIKRMLQRKENKVNLQDAVQKDIDYAKSKKEKRMQKKLEKKQSKVENSKNEEIKEASEEIKNVEEKKDEEVITE